MYFIRQILKYLLRILIGITFLILVFLLAWYLSYFAPYIEDLNKLSQKGKQNIAYVEEKLFTYAIRAENTDGLRNALCRASIWTFLYKQKPVRNISWHLNNLLYLFASKIHFDDKEVFYIWTEFAPYEKGIGIKNSARYYFSKPLSELSDRELATIVAITRSPNYYTLGNPRLERRVNHILDYP